MKQSEIALSNGITLKPEGVSNAIGFYRTAADNISLATKCTVHNPMPSKGTLAKVTWKLAVPSVVTTVGSYKAVADTTTVTITIALPKNGLPATRNDVYMYLSSLVKSDQFKSTIVDMEAIYG